MISTPSTLALVVNSTIVSITTTSVSSTSLKSPTGLTTPSALLPLEEHNCPTIRFILVKRK